jgi:hypothetical protein
MNNLDQNTSQAGRLWHPAPKAQFKHPF